MYQPESAARYLSSITITVWGSSSYDIIGGGSSGDGGMMRPGTPHRVVVVVSELHSEEEVGIVVDY